MPLCPACLLVLGATLGVSVPGSYCGSFSLHYFYLRLLEPSQGLPSFFIWGYLNDQPITHYDSLTGRVEPLVSWMKEVKKETFPTLEWVFRSELEELSRLNQLTDELHTWQVILGCELREDGNKDRVFRYGYNGMDFISFQKKTLRWRADQPQAEKVKEEWDEDAGWSQANEDFLENTCIKRLQSYRKEALRKTEPPVGKMTRKVVNDSLETLICQTFGFYPKEIQATWTRDGENWEHETCRKNVVPNSDGTYYVRISIEIDPKERDRFQCHLEHDGLQEPLVLAWKEKTRWYIDWWIVPVLILGLLILFLICRRWRRCRILYQKVRTSPYTEEDRIQSEPLLQSVVTMEDGSSYERLRHQQVVEVSASTLRKREGKKHRPQRSVSWAGDTEILDQDMSKSDQLSWPKSY